MCNPFVINRKADAEMLGFWIFQSCHPFTVLEWRHMIESAIDMGEYVKLVYPFEVCVKKKHWPCAKKSIENKLELALIIESIPQYEKDAQLYSFLKSKGIKV